MKLSISLSLAALAGSCLLVPVAAHARQAAKAHQQTESIHLRDGQLPDINLTADLMYRILAAEIGARDGQYDLASQTFLDLAKDTSDPRLAKRAFQFSMADRNIARALIAAREWVQLAPNDPEAVASSLAQIGRAHV